MLYLKGWERGVNTGRTKAEMVLFGDSPFTRSECGKG